VQKFPESAKKQQLTENKKSTEYRNTSKFYLVRGEISTLELPSVTPLL